MNTIFGEILKIKMSHSMKKLICRNIKRFQREIHICKTRSVILVRQGIILIFGRGFKRIKIKSMRFITFKHNCIASDQSSDLVVSKGKNSAIKRVENRMMIRRSPGMFTSDRLRIEDFQFLKIRSTMW